MPPSGPRSSWWRTPITSADCSIAFSIAFSTMSSTGVARAPDGHVRSGRVQQPGRRVAERRRRSARGRPAAPRRAPRSARRARAASPAAPRSPRPTPSASRSSASRSRLRACSRICSAAPARTSSRLEFSTSQEHAPGEPLAQVGVQLGLEVADELLRARRPAAGRSRGACRARTPPRRCARGGRRLLLLDAALVVRLRPAALVVAAVDVVLDPVGLLELVAVAGEQPRDAAVDEQHAPALGRRPRAPAARRTASRRAPRASSSGWRSDTTSSRSSGWQANTATARVPLAGDVAAEHLAHALDVGLQRLALVVLEVAGLLDRGGRPRSAPR